MTTGLGINYVQCIPSSSVAVRLAGRRLTNDETKLHSNQSLSVTRTRRTHTLYTWYIRSVGRGREGMASPRFFQRGRRVPHSSHFFGQKFVQKLVHCCNWLLTETQCKILFQYSGIFLTCMSVRVCRPKLFKNLCVSLVSGVPHYFLGLHPCPRYACGRTPIVTARLHHRFGSAPG